MNCDILVVGASLGGVLSAYASAKEGKKVILTEETDWIGGQLTSQAVPPDENRWIEFQGATKTYMEFRKKIREYYANLENASENMKGKDVFNPGSGWVSRICHEPLVAKKILEEMLNPFIKNGNLDVLYNTVAVDSLVVDDKIESVTLKNDKNKEFVVKANYFLDATDMGDLLPIVKAEYRTGAESKNQTNEFHAVDVADPYDMQPITYVVALGLVDRDKFKEEYKIEKPKSYDFFKSLLIPNTNKSLMSWFTPSDKAPYYSEYRMFDNQLKEGSLGLWSYRRIISKENYVGETEEVSLINWPQNDFNYGNIYEEAGFEDNRILAREQTMSMVYWLQNEAENEIGGFGYPVRLRGDILGTSDGIAKAPYIRESRRIVALKQIKEQDVSKKTNSGLIRFEDSVGVGHYSIDVHLTTKTHTTLYDPTYPFEISLASMIPVKLKNLIPACKNIGTTHLTNGCYRLHPIEWNIGEVAGYLASYCIKNNCTPKDVLKNNLKDFQDILIKNGVQLHWDEKSMF